MEVKCVSCVLMCRFTMQVQPWYLLLCDFCWIKYGVEVGSVCSVIDRKLLRLHIYFTVCSISVFRSGFCMCSGVCVHICFSLKSHHHHQVRTPKFDMRTQHIDVCNAMRYVGLSPYTHIHKIEIDRGLPKFSHRLTDSASFYNTVVAAVAVAVALLAAFATYIFSFLRRL